MDKKKQKQKREEVPVPAIPKEVLKNYLKGKDEVKAIQFAEEFAKYLQAGGFTISKLRGFFNEVIRYDIQDKAEKSNILLLKPKLAYLVGRETNNEKRQVASNFKKVMEIMIDELLSNDPINKDYYKNFANFLKAIVAYHKYYGGK